MRREYAILQLRQIDGAAHELFASIRELERMGLYPNAGHYQAVYAGYLPPYEKIGELLEGLYMVFNINVPEGFKGHSLSVSDIIAIKEDDSISCYYVDSFGFKDLPGFITPEDYQRMVEIMP